MEITKQTIRVDGRTIAATGQAADLTPNAADARAMLKGMRAELVDGNGQVRAGYLRIRSANGRRHLEAQSRWAWGAKSDARQFVQSLVETAYGHLGKDAKAELDRQMTAYFRQSGNRMGTQSFVRLVNTLEAIAEASPGTASVADEPPAIQAALTPNARLNLEPVARLSLRSLEPLEAPQGAFGAGAAPLISHAQAQMTALKDALSRSQHPYGREASRVFAALLAPPKLNPAGLEAHPSAPIQHVVGDADGSLCRVLTAAMASGHLSLTPAGIKQLAELMGDEAEALAEDALQAFQANQQVAERFDALLPEIRVHPSADGRRLIFLGDLLHDRLSNNKQALARVMERLAGQGTQRTDRSPGVIFILGNHDSFDEVQGAAMQNFDQAIEKNQALSAKEKQEWREMRVQNGFLAVKDLTANESNQLNQTCFRRAWFDAELGVFYSHNGVVKDGNQYVTGIGRFAADSPAALAAMMNASALLPKDTKDFTDFRPKEEKISNEGLESVQVNGQEKPIYQAHGHNGVFGTTGRSINLNARQGEYADDWAPICAVLNSP